MKIRVTLKIEPKDGEPLKISTTDFDTDAIACEWFLSKKLGDVIITIEKG